MFQDTKILRQDAGRIEMMVSHKTEMNNGIYYSILRTNPSDPVRNVRIFEARFEKTYKHFPIHPLFLQLMKKYQTIRFMPWSNVQLQLHFDELRTATNPIPLHVLATLSSRPADNTSTNNTIPTNTKTKMETRNTKHEHHEAKHERQTHSQ